MDIFHQTLGWLAHDGLWMTLLVMARVGPVIFLLPFLGGGRLVPITTRLAITLALGCVLLPTSLAAASPLDPHLHGPDGQLLWGLLLLLGLKEALVGASLAAPLVMILWGLSMSGSAIDTLRLSSIPPGQGVLDESATPSANLLVLLTSVCWLASGGHLATVAALAWSYTWIPALHLPPSPPSIPHLIPTIALMATQLFTLALALALPVLAAVWLAQLLLALALRLLPDVSRLLRGLPITALVGLVVLLVVLRSMLGVVLDGLEQATGALDALFGR